MFAHCKSRCYRTLRDRTERASPSKTTRADPKVRPLFVLRSFYFTTNCTVALCGTVPEVAVIVMGYVPAGVPLTGVGVVPLVPHPACNSISDTNPAKTNPPRRRRLRDIFPLMPKPTRASPETGSQGERGPNGP